MKNIKLKNKLLIILTLMFVLCLSLSFSLLTKTTTASSFENSGPAFNNITHASGTYTITETDGVNMKFDSVDKEFVYSNLDISTLNGNQKFINFYVNMLGDRFVNIYVDIIDSTDSSNYVSVKVNSKDGNSTHDSSLSAAVPSIGQLYTGCFFGNEKAVRVNSTNGHRKYSNITVSDSTTNRTAYTTIKLYC